MNISIIIPVYNVEAYIGECLESVARQTYNGEIECLIIDDCGKDGSMAVVEKFIQSYHGKVVFKIIHHEHNRGLSAARNTGVEVAKGDYVYFIDSDDAIIPETIEEMVKIVKEHPQVEMVQGGIVSMNGLVVDNFIIKELPEFTDNAEWIAKNMLFNLPVSSCNRMLKRDFLHRKEISFHEGIIHEDVPYCYQLALKCRHIGFVRKNTYLFRPQREGSITTTPQEKRALQSRVIIMNDCIDAYLRCFFISKSGKMYAYSELWRKWLRYMNKHSNEALMLYHPEVSKILRRLVTISPFPYKICAIIYSLLPLRFQGNQYIIKIARKYIIC